MRILARLNRFYSFRSDGGSPSPIVEYFIKGDCTHSDHLPVWGKFSLKPSHPRKSSYKMSARFLKVDEVKDRITAIWTSKRPRGFIGKLCQVVRFYKSYYLQAAKSQREADAHLRAQLSDAVEALEADPGNAELQGRLSSLGEQLGEFEKHLVEGLKVATTYATSMSATLVQRISSKPTRTGEMESR